MKMFQIIWTLALVLNQNVLTIKNKVECGYKQCPATRDGTLNVHLIPHSHMDAGWVKNFDDYYYGTKTSISSANVQLIYHSVLSELPHDKRRRFTFSETGYFWRWWKEQRPATRSTFRALVQEGRIEFAGGGWVQNDEATADYLQIIDQFTWGLRKLNDTIGPCGKPKAGWQIDPYGHTREQASLLAQMGYDGLFIGRVDHKVREAMIEEDRMEFMWRGSDVLGKMSDIMTHTLFNLYNAPEGFCFDFLCSDEPIVDDPDNQLYNVDKRVSDFIAQIEKQAKYYDHDNIVVTLGGDFTYQSAASWFMNIDKLINHVITHPANMSDINIFYSTPSCYLKSIYLYGRRDKAVHTDKGDHLPYGSDSFTYWTGFYTSRPSLKYLARRAHIFLQMVKQLTVIARTGDSYELHFLRHATSLILHHDAITGTSQQHVTNDFIKTVNEAIEACTRKASNMLSYLTPTWGGSRRSKSNQQFTTCHQLNMSQCRFAETQESMLVLVYNPSSVKTYHYVKLPAMALHYSIRDANDEEVEYQLVPLPSAVRNLPGRNSPAVQELCFEAENIPPLGYTAYYISAVRAQLEENTYAKKAKQDSADAELEVFPQISNEYIKVAVNKDTGLLEFIQHVDGVRIQVSQNFYFYSQGSQPLQSGAYSFRPTTNRPTPDFYDRLNGIEVDVLQRHLVVGYNKVDSIETFSMKKYIYVPTFTVTERVTYNAVRGNLVKEIRQKFNDWVTQIIRLYRGEEFLELEWVIGPVPVGTDLGKEVVSIFTTNITNVGEFYTDSNARQMMKRSCWNTSTNQIQKKPIAEGYYPVTSRICIQSQNSSVGMCVLTDRAQGGTSYDEGQIELMVHRRLLTDDGFGLDENLNEEEHGTGMVIRGKHRIVFGNFRQELDGMTFSERAAQAARRWKLEPWLFLTPGEKISRRKWLNVRNKRYSALRIHALPRHIHVLTLEPWKTGTILLRLENTLEKSSRGRLKLEKRGLDDKSSHISLDLRKLFLQLEIKAVRETTLAANQWLDDARQMDWSTRYVYAGGEEGLPPEDLDYVDENKPLMQKEMPKEDAKDSVPYSDEESYNSRNRPRLKQRNDQKTMSKVERPYQYERRKRSSNLTENISKNIIHTNYDDRFYKLKTDFAEQNDFITTEATKPLAIFIKKPVNNTYIIDKLIDIEDNIDAIINATEKTETQTNKSTLDNDKKSVTKKLQSYLTKSKVNQNYRKARFFDWVRENDEEIGSSEENLSANLKKRSSKRKPKYSKHRNPEIFYDDSDDGITKSIYEMYYRTRTAKPRSNPFKPFLRSSEEYFEKPQSRKEHKKRRHRDDDVTEREGHMIRNKGRNKFTTSLPFLTTTDRFENKEVNEEYKRRFERMDNMPSYKSKSNEELLHSRAKRRRDMSTSEEDYDNISDYVEDGEEMERRWKRAIEKDDYIQRERSETTEQPTEDYIVTLRPTQIRTFVIWLVNSKKLHRV